MPQPSGWVEHMSSHLCIVSQLVILIYFIYHELIKINYFKTDIKSPLATVLIQTNSECYSTA